MDLRKHVFVAFMLIIFSCSANHSFGSEPVVVKGKVNIPYAEGRIVNLHYCKDHYAMYAPTIRGITYTSTIKNGSFQFKIENPSPYAYIQFEFGSVDSLLHSTPRSVLTWRLYLLGSDREISFTINNDQCIFSAANKLMDCQYKLYERAFNDTGLRYPPIEDFAQIRQQFKAHYDSVYHDQLAILRKYENSIKPEFIELLKVDFFADCERRSMEVITYTHMGFNYHYFRTGKPEDFDEPDEDKKFIHKSKGDLEFYVRNYLFHQYDTSRADIRFFSRSYAELLYRKEFCDVGLGMLSTTDHIWPSFSQVADKIAQSYRGLLREKVLSLAFLHLNQGATAKITDQDMNMALDQMKNEECRAIVQRVKDRRGSGRPAFNFKLQDTAGRTITQEMLKGKFVIMDFWFTGCTGCSFLNKKMTPVYEHFNNNPDVVFLSISVDKDVETWRNYGLKSGLYTHPGSLNVFTNGLGQEDPVVKHYDVMAFPTLILIDKQGNVASGTPPRPVTPENIQRFIELVEEHL